MEEYTLYRTYAKHGALLYIGQSNSWPRRMKEHSRHSDWFESVARVEIESYVTKDQLDEAERAAITEEKPIHNIVHNGNLDIDQERWLTHSETVQFCDISARTLTRRLQSGAIQGAVKDSTGQWLVPVKGLLSSGYSVRANQKRSPQPLIPRVATEAERLKAEVAALVHENSILTIQLEGARECLRIQDAHLNDYRTLIIPIYEARLKLYASWLKPKRTKTWSR